MANARIGALRVDLGMNTAAFEKGATLAERRMNRLSKSMGRVGAKMKSVGRTLTLGLTAPLAAFGYKATQVAIDAEEMESAFDVVFGKMSKDVRAWAQETGDAMGRSTQEIQRGALAFQELFGKALEPQKAAEMSKQFAVLTQDLASFKNLSNDVAQQKLFSGLTGEAEPLRAVGVFINEAAVKSKALELGLEAVNGKFTDQQKIVARAALIQEQLASAQGDVLRTSDSTANQIKTFSAAMEELSVKVGDVLLPAITPIITGIARMVDGFAKLSPGVQTAAVVFAGLAAAIGPILVVVGSAMTVFAGLGAAMAPVALVAAAIAAAGYLIYKNWDTIGPVLEELWVTLQATIGPPLMELIDTLKKGLTELWNGPLGDAVKAAIPILMKFQAAYISVLGEGLSAVIKMAAEVLKGLFALIADGVNLVSEMFNGEWADALNSGMSLINRLFGGLPAYVIGKVSAMVNGIRVWLIEKLGAIFRHVGDKIETVKGAFFDLYDAVVGNSYIPDMVDGIADHMARLDQVMVGKAVSTTKQAGDAFRALASDVRSIMAEVFPDAARLRDYRDKIARVDQGQSAGIINGETAAQLRNGLLGGLSRFGPRKEPGLIMSESEVTAPVQIMERETKRISDSIADLLTDTKTTTVGIAKSFGDMAKNSISALQSMTDAIKSGGFLDILGAVINLGLQLGSVGLFGKKAQKNINSYGGARAAGGPVSLGKSYLVGENGPEMFTPGASGAITPNHAMGGGIAQIVPSPYFDVVVDGRVMSAAPAIANGGAALANNRAARMQQRRTG